MKSVDNYQKAVRAWHAARAELGEIVQLAESSAVTLKDWKSADPVQYNGSLDRTIRSWPLREEFQAAVTAWKHTPKELTAAWDALAEVDRAGLMSPQLLQAEASKAK